MTDIIKVQRPPSAKELAKPWLLIDKARTHVEQRADAFISEVVKAAVGNAPAGYFQAEWSKPDGWKIGSQVLSENW